MKKKVSYGWKDLLTDAAIVSVVAGIALFTVGSFPDFFTKILHLLNKWDDT